MNKTATLLALFSATAQAGIEVTAQESWNLYSGSRIEQRGFSSKAACEAAAPLDVERKCEGSERFIRRADAPPPPPPPPAPPPPAPPPPAGAACPPGGTAAGSWNATGLTCPFVRFEGSASRLVVGGTYPGIEIGGYSTTASNVTIRGAKLQGPSGTTFGLFLRGDHQNIVFEDGEITGFGIGVHMPVGNSSGFVLRNTKVHQNTGMGMLGASPGGLIVGNTFEANNSSGSNFNHAIYLGSSTMETAGMRVTGNTFIDNSVVNGVCTGGQLTAHGRFRDLQIEGNEIRVPSATGACYGMSITPAYTSTEWFRGLVIRGNTVRNTGGHAIAVASAVGAVIEGNRAFNAGSIGQGIPPGSGDDQDQADQTKVIRNNCGAAIALTGQQSGNTGACQ